MNLFKRKINCRETKDCENTKKEESMPEIKVIQSMQKIFEVAHGTVVGSDHRWSGRNNQDSFHWLTNDKAIVAVVCDGCGGTKHSEVGAKLASRFLTEFIFNEIQPYQDMSITNINSIIERSHHFLLNFVYYIASKIDFINIDKTLNDFFLFTVVGVVITKEDSLVFSAADGVFIVNEKLTILGPFPNNEPPYPTYQLMSDSYASLQIQQITPTENVNNILIGTDGVSDLIKSEKYNVPGKAEKVGPISQFWEKDHYFQNPEMINRRLNVLNTDIIYPKWLEERLEKVTGLLRDDTTMIVIRRKKGEKDQ